LTAQLQEKVITMKNKILGAFYILKQSSPEISLQEIVAVALEETKAQVFSVYSCFEGLIQRIEKNKSSDGSSKANVQKHKVSLRHLRE
jgi:hypothetical protein